MMLLWVAMRGSSCEGPEVEGCTARGLHQKTEMKGVLQGRVDAVRHATALDPSCPRCGCMLLGE